jgi:hypothetical protein
MPVKVAALMVRVEVPLPPPTTLGERLQPVLPRLVATLQLRLTLPVKPFVGATVMVTVPFCPLEMVSELTEEDKVKLGPGAESDTRSCRVWVRVTPLTVPVAVIVIEPVNAEEDALTVSVLETTVEAMAVTGLGLSEQVRPVVPEQE